MKLYHGSNVSIEAIDLKRGRKGKDFGQGFYNRRNKTDKQAHDYDIVYGPIADDKVGLQISRYDCNISKWTS